MVVQQIFLGGKAVWLIVLVLKYYLILIHHFPTTGATACNLGQIESFQQPTSLFQTDCVVSNL